MTGKKKLDLGDMTIEFFKEIPLEEQHKLRERIDESIRQTAKGLLDLAKKERDAKQKEVDELEKLAGIASSKPASGKVRTTLPPKYRSKKDAAKTWSGKGHTPGWLKDEMAKAGKEKDHFLIKK